VTAGNHNSGQSIVLLPIVLDNDGLTRLSGGEISTGIGGTIDLLGAENVLLQGAVGGVAAGASGLVATTTAVDAVSTGGAINVSGRMAAANDVKSACWQVAAFAAPASIQKSGCLANHLYSSNRLRTKLVN
jgi:hypothetical protein